MIEIESKFFDIEILRQIAKELYMAACQNPCKLTRGRAGWDLLKTNATKKKFQSQFVELCNQKMSDQELYQNLQTENLQILIK